MDNFKVIYKILKILEKAMDYECLDTSAISYKALDITKERWCAIIEMLMDCGYVKGVVAAENFAGKSFIVQNMRITIKGLEYLNENNFMKKAANVAKGVIDIVT